MPWKRDFQLDCLKAAKSFQSFNESLFILTKFLFFFAFLEEKQRDKDQNEQSETANSEKEDESKELDENDTENNAEQVCCFVSC